tara:strand:+ start:7 stop:492 length:486 start_codon:yes stop_codon:yes gene_type:complete
MANIANQTTIDQAEPVMVGSESFSSGLRAAGALVKVYKYTGDMPVDGTPCADGSIVVDDGIPAYNIPFLTIVKNTGALAFQSNAAVLEQETSDLHLTTTLSGLAVGASVATLIKGEGTSVYNVPKDILNEDADLESSGAAQSAGITIWLYCYDVSSVMNKI